MDPQKLIFLDKQVVKSERIISLLFTFILGALLILIKQGIVPTAHYSEAVIWIGLIGFIGLGILQYLWNPYTRRKVLLYDLSFAFFGAIVSIFLVGFGSSLVFLGWMMLIITAAVYFKKLFTGIMYGIFMFSLVIWLLLNYETLGMGIVIEMLAAGILIGLITLYIIEIWGLFNRSVFQLDNSRGNEHLARERLSSLINSMVDGVLAVDNDCNIVEYNGALLNILDLNLTLHGKNVNLIGKFVDSNNQPVDLSKFVKSTKSQQINSDYKIIYSDNSKANLYISVASVRFGFGREYSKGYVLVMRDITREKSLEEERDEFISVISHELRTPIAIAEGEVSNAQFMIKQSSSQEKVAEAINRAYSQVMFLSDMVNDLSTLSRAERGKLDIQASKINISKLLDELRLDYEPQAKAKGLKLTFEIKDSVKDLNSSELYVKEILQNFITNAIKYTESGWIKVSAHNSNKGIEFEVSDSGIGISKVDQEKVFDKFFRSEDFRTRANNGTGLGLYVTMKLARLIHAEIELDSSLDKGSKFTITLPNID